MPKVPYELLAPEANKIIVKMTLAKDLKTISYWWDVYVSLLANAGWDPISYEKEEARRTDAGWDDSKPIVWN